MYWRRRRLIIGWGNYHGNEGTTTSIIINARVSIITCQLCETSRKPWKQIEVIVCIHTINYSAAATRYVGDFQYMIQYNEKGTALGQILAFASRRLCMYRAGMPRASICQSDPSHPPPLLSRVCRDLWHGACLAPELRHRGGGTLDLSCREVPTCPASI